MDRFDAMRRFLRVVETGSFSAAARETGMGQSAVSKQVAALEAHLGAQLLRRTSRSLALTEAGQSFYEAALRVIADLDTAESLVGRGRSAPSGLVRVSVAPVFGRVYVTPLLPGFLARYPDITVEMTASGRPVDLVEDAIDVAIRNGPLPTSSMVARSLGASPVVTVATPAYLAARGEPQTPADLDGHDGVAFMQRGEVRPWTYGGPDGPVLHRPRARFRTSDAEQTRAAVLADLGLAQAPVWLFAPDLASGAVRAVLRGTEPAPIPISLVRAADRRLPTRTRVFVDLLVEALASDQRLWSV